MSISKFTLGTVQLGMEYGLANTSGKPSMQTGFDILAAAARNGVTSIDTATSYGDSESVIGGYFAAGGGVFETVTSKFRLAAESEGSPAQRFRKQLDLTKRRLGIPKIPIYMFHSAPEMIAHCDELEPLLRAAVRDGEIGAVGASVYTCAEIEQFLKHPVLKAIQFPLNALDLRAVTGGMLAELEKRGVTVFVRSVFLQGLLCMPVPPPQYSFIAPYVGQLNEIARSEDLSAAQLAVSFIRDLPGVDSLALGCETVAQVLQNCEIIQTPALSDRARADVMTLAATVPIERVMQQILAKK